LPVKLYEFEGRELFRRYGIPVTEYGVAGSVEEVRRLAEEFGGEGCCEGPDPRRRQR
jgi:succinyl-CoA synthetase beta subunit